MLLSPGTRLGPYEILDAIGAGGMGQVYKALDTRLGREVAIKVLPDTFIDQPSRDRFLREARAASALSHPGICAIYDIGESDGRPHLVMELLSGQTLKQRIARRPLDLATILSFGIQIADALDAAHSKGVIHRDIKPANIMIGDRGQVKILDFGIAKVEQGRQAEGTGEDTVLSATLTTPGTTMGSYAYMSPEQARGQVDSRTDLWSLGVVLYEMATGSMPFEGPTAGSILEGVFTRNPDPIRTRNASIPLELDRIIFKALEKVRDIRYQSAADLRTDLKRVDRELNSTQSNTAQATISVQATINAAPPGPASNDSGVNVPRPRGWWKYAIAAAMVVVAGSGFFWWQSLHTKPLSDKDIVVLADFANTTGDTVFDGALKSALAVQLGQSPFLKIRSVEEVREALKFAGHKPDERVTRQIARDICERAGDKAVIAGSIDSLGKTYVVTLEAVNCANGETLAREQVESPDKEHVLKGLSGAAAALRSQLGESPSSIAKLPSEFKQVTTGSLEAFKAYGGGEEQKNKGLWHEAIPFYERATALDPNFAMAYARLWAAYKNDEAGKDIENAKKAFELVDRVSSERERLYISGVYFFSITRDLDKSIETFQLYQREYPRDVTPLGYLGGVYSVAGKFEAALKEYQESARIEPRSPVTYANLALMYIALNRFDEAKQSTAKAITAGMGGMAPHVLWLRIAYLENDAATARKEIQWAVGKPQESRILKEESSEAEYLGRWHKARELRRKSSDAAGVAAWDALGAAVLGDCTGSRNQAKAAIALDRDMRNIQFEATALTLCGDAVAAQKFAEESAKQFPSDTLNNTVGIPSVNAAMELKRGEPEKAIEFLKSAQPYDLASAVPVYLRGLAFLSARKGVEAEVEFQKILDHKAAYWENYALLCALSQAGLARAAAIAGDTAKSRKAYQDFLALWKDADPDLPILAEARKELAALR